MSFLVNSTILDESVAENLRVFLNQQLDKLDTPSFIGKLNITALSFGTQLPDIKLIDITDPCHEFYLPDNIPDPDPISDMLNSSRSSLLDDTESFTNLTFNSHYNSEVQYTEPNFDTEPFENNYPRHENDTQIEIGIEYKGNMRVTIITELHVNQPVPSFMVLPLTVTLTGFHFSAKALVAYLKDRIVFCFKESENGESLVRDISIESEVGDSNRNILKNVNKIEKFIVHQITKVIDDFPTFPSYHSFEGGSSDV